MSELDAQDWAVLAFQFITIFIGGLGLAYYMRTIFLRPTQWMLRWEQRFFRILKISDEAGGWKSYAKSLLLFHLIGFILLLGILHWQNYLPLNPEKIIGMPWWMAINTAMSFVTNTNWQSYSGEVSLSYFSQMIGLTTQNFLSAATGICVLLVFIRGFLLKEKNIVGNFWSDLFRGTVYLLLPLSFVFALLISQQGVIQNFNPYKKVTTLEGSQQIIPMGPVASQVAIKQLGTNGGGYFGVNSAHPLENPTPLSNFYESVAILLLPLSCVLFFGLMLNRPGQAYSLLGTMFLLYIVLLAISLHFEHQTNAALFNLPFLEGKESRLSLTESVLWGVSTTAASNGSVNSILSSFSPLSGCVFLFQIMLGEIIFGGVGAGMYGMLLFVIITVFLTGLMVGRTPEYLGKKIEAREIKLAAIGVLLPSVLILMGTAFALNYSEGLKTMLHQGPHGLSEVLFAFSSAAGNNGSAFAGLGVSTPFYEGMLALCMFFGRFGVIIPALSIAGGLARKKIIPESSGTFPTDTAFFSFILGLVILTVGALTFFPALCLGPIVEHLKMMGF